MTDQSPDRTETQALQTMQASIVDVLGNLTRYTKPAIDHLRDAIRAHAEAEGVDPQSAFNDVSHFEAVRSWCSDNQDTSACIVLLALYLSHAHVPVQGAGLKGDVAPDPSDEPAEVAQ